ncbi:MAG: sugar phosphate isomerase/epimerase family protein [Thermoguttaceae bacterium]
MQLTRREFTFAASGMLLSNIGPNVQAAGETFRLRYILASSMYGCTDVTEILSEVRKTGATTIDLWPRVHGDQREQLEAMGERRFAELLRQHKVGLGCITQYKLGPFGLADEMRLCARLGCRLIVTGASGPKGRTGTELRSAVVEFVEKMKPHLELAAETGVTIAIENHANSLIESPDSLKWLAELRPSKHLAVAFAPYHLPQEEKLLSDLIRALDDRIAMFYAWQHGMGSKDKLPKEQELLQMPGRGSLDFRPLLAALHAIRYEGWTEVFMHPVPRGIPILETTAQVSDEINRGRQYLERCLLRK